MPCSETIILSGRDGRAKAKVSVMRIKLLSLLLIDSKQKSSINWKIVQFIFIVVRLIAQRECTAIDNTALYVRSTPNVCVCVSAQSNGNAVRKTSEYIYHRLENVFVGDLIWFGLPSTILPVMGKMENHKIDYDKPYWMYRVGIHMKTYPIGIGKSNISEKKCRNNDAKNGTHIRWHSNP